MISTTLGGAPVAVLASKSGIGGSGLVLGAALNSMEESCSCSRVACSLKSSLEFSAARLVGAGLFSGGAVGACRFDAVKAGCISGALRRLAADEGSEAGIEAAGIAGIAGVVATGGNGRTVVGMEDGAGFEGAGITGVISVLGACGVGLASA